MIGYTTKSRGMHLTERKIKHFDEIAKMFKRFVSVSQFENKVKNVMHLSKFTELGEPKLMTGEVLYGVSESGHLTWLGDIIDSSD